MIPSFSLKMNVSKWQAIIFDLDDTLYPERDFVLGGFRTVAQWLAPRVGLSPRTIYDQLQLLYDSGVRGDTFDLLLESLGQTDAGLISSLVQIYRNHTPHLEPFPEVISVLSGLKAEGYRLGLLSDGYLSVQQRKLKALAIASYFNAIVFSDQLGRDAWKPSTKPFKVILNQLAVPPDVAVYIADNPLKDFLGARRVGMWTIQIRRLGGEYMEKLPPTPEHAPHAIISDLEELVDLIRTSREKHS